MNRNNKVRRKAPVLRTPRAAAAVLFLPSAAVTQQQPDSAVTMAPAKKADGGTHRWKMLHVNEFQTPWTTFRIGGAILPEFAAYNQNANSRAQVAQIQGGDAAARASGVRPG